jgi:hypothetical protein
MPRKSAPRPPVRSDVECELDGKTYRGTYEVSRGLLTVSWAYGSKSAAPGAAPNVLARIMLRELVQDAKRQGLLAS